MTDDLDIDEPDDSAPVAASTTDQPLRYSVLKLMGKSPAHARDAMLRQGDGATLALRLGSGCHALTFEDRPVVVYPGKQRRGKEWDEFAAANASAVILNAKEYAQAKGMSDAIRSHPVASRVLLRPEVVREKRIDWEWNGRTWRSTPDAMDFRTLAELKTTRCADPAVFWRDALRMSYHVQLAIYRRAIEQATGIKPREVYLFAVESVRPYVVTPFQFTERSLEHGDRLAKEWHERFLTCEATNHWPGYTTGIEDLDVYDINDELDVEVERAMANDDGQRAAVGF
jgi:hypothetical protein